MPPVLTDARPRPGQARVEPLRTPEEAEAVLEQMARSLMPNANLGQLAQGPSEDM